MTVTIWVTVHTNTVLVWDIHDNICTASEVR